MDGPGIGNGHVKEEEDLLVPASHQIIAGHLITNVDFMLTL